MDNNKIKAKEQQAPSISSKSTIAQQGTTSAANAIDKLKEYGGFTFLENIIDVVGTKGIVDKVSQSYVFDVIKIF